MITASIYFHNEKYTNDFLTNEDIISLSKHLLMNEMYCLGGRITLDTSDTETVDKIFDISNNEVIKRCCDKDLSAGDIININDTNYLYTPDGWLAIGCN